MGVIERMGPLVGVNNPKVAGSRVPMPAFGWAE